MSTTTVNETYLRGIASNDFSVLQRIYKESLPNVIQHVQKNSGTTEDAKDIFQEAILILFKKVKKGDLELKTSFSAYLFGICKMLWLKKLKKNSKIEVTNEDLGEHGYEDNIEEQFLKSKKWTLFNQKFQQLADECKKVLKMSFNKTSNKDIANRMGYTEEYAKRKKYKCKQGLTELIKKDQQYRLLTT